MTSADARLRDLIDELGTDLKPVRRLARPTARAAAWIGVVLVVAVLLACFADLRGLVHRMAGAPDMWLSVLGSTLTAVLAALSTFELAMPDRRPAWALLPAPALMVWIGASGMGCLRGWGIPGEHGATLEEARVCFGFIVGLSVPLSIVTVAMVRRACPLYPSLTAALAGLAAGSAAATLLNLFHPYDAAPADLAFHAVAVALVVGVNQALAGRLSGRIEAPNRGLLAGPRSDRP